MALVTGGSRGIGLGIAQSLAREGWSLAINGIRAEQQVQESLDRLRKTGTEVIYCQGDVGEANDRQAVVQQTVDRLGTIDLLVNNAGITSPGRLDILEATAAVTSIRSTVPSRCSLIRYARYVRLRFRTSWATR